MNGVEKYVAPNRRMQSTQSTQSTQSMQSTQSNNFERKSAQHFDMQSTSEFPELGAVASKHGDKDNKMDMNMNYAGATKEEEEANTICPNAVAPGWVRIHRDPKGQGPIQREYGDVKTNAVHGEEQTNWGLTASQSNELNRLVNRWQTDRDNANDFLDQSSPYWGMKHIDDPLSDDDLESEKGSEMSDEDENSEGMDDEYDDYYH
jgi:hypothetical protein